MDRIVLPPLFSQGQDMIIIEINDYPFYFTPSPTLARRSASARRHEGRGR